MRKATRKLMRIGLPVADVVFSLGQFHSELWVEAKCTSEGFDAIKIRFVKPSSVGKNDFAVSTP